MDLLTGLWRDLKLAVRSLVKARAFTFVCVLSLGIGMTPVIAVPYGSQILSRQPRGLNTDTLVEVVSTPQGSRQATSVWSYPDFLDLQAADTGATLTGWAWAPSEVTLDPSLGGKTSADTIYVARNYFSVMGVALAQGPGFGDTADPTVIVSQDFWQRKLGSDPALVGKPIMVNKVPHTVVGIMASPFVGHLGDKIFDLFIPLERHPQVLADNTIRFDRAKEWVDIHGRLSPGIDREHVSGVIGVVTAQLAKEHPATNESKLGIAEPYYPIGSLATAQLAVIRRVLQALTVLPLLVICLNITGMVQVRSAMRERELSIRQAVGATRKRLMQQLLAEAVVLAAMGAALASLVLFNIPPLLAWWMEQPLPPQIADALHVDATMIAIVIVMCLATSLVFGWLPAARFSRPVIITVLKDDSGSGGVRAGRLQRVATALQVAIATPLLIISGMTLDRVRATATDYLGFESEVLYAGPLVFDAVEGADAAFKVRSAQEELARTAGVASVTVADGLPLDFRYRMTRVSTVVEAGAAPKTVSVHTTRVGDRYLETLGIPLIRGRQFGPEDTVGGEDVTIVAKPLAERLFPGEDPIGKQVLFGADEKNQRTLTVIGVTADFPTSQMSTDRAQLLLPLAQHPDILKDSVDVDDDRGGSARLMLVARSVPGAQAQSLTGALENLLRGLDPEFESTSIVTGVGLREFSMNDFLNQSAVGGVVGGVLLLLAALGIYGVVGLMVATRIREIAVRVALGASRRRVMGMVLFDVVKLVLPGIFVGLLIAVAFVRLNGQDFGISLSNLEPLAYFIGCAIALLIAVLASLAPARRAASVHPMVAMRSE